MKNQIIEKIFRVVIYLRLSDEDGDNQESDSISNQRILNRGFLEGKQEFQIVKEDYYRENGGIYFSESQCAYRALYAAFRGGGHHFP